MEGVCVGVPVRVVTGVRVRVPVTWGVSVPLGVPLRGQPSGGAGMMSPCALCAGSERLSTVIRTQGFLAEPVRWQIVVLWPDVAVVSGVSVATGVCVLVRTGVCVLVALGVWVLSGTRVSVSSGVFVSVRVGRRSRVSVGIGVFVSISVAVLEGATVPDDTAVGVSVSPTTVAVSVAPLEQKSPPPLRSSNRRLP